MSLLGSIGSGIARIGGGFLTGGIGGAITGAVSTFGGGGGAAGPPKPPGMFGSSPVPYGTFPNVGPYIPVPGIIGQSGPGPAPTTCPKGYHLNKHALAATKKHGPVPAHSMCVRNRSINPLNHRALSRSFKRLKRASKLVRKLHVVSQPHQRRLPPGRKR